MFFSPKDIQTTEITKQMFPKEGFALFLKMASGQYNLLKLIVEHQEDKKPINIEDVKEIYKKTVCRKEYKEMNVRGWLVRNIGSLVLGGYLRISTKLNKKIMVELENIRENQFKLN